MYECEEGAIAPFRPNWGHRILPVVIAAVAMLLSYPFAEAGVVDDWSYVWTAREFARTGHVYYNGWSTAMLGWQIYVGGAFVKLAGPSFTAIRMSIVLTSLLLIALTNECFRLAGLSKENSRFCAITFFASASFLQSATAFMSDVPGMVAIYVCFYCCLRAHRCTNPERATMWVILSITSNAVLGTARQIAWLGLITIVPLVIWQQRARLQKYLVALSIVWATAIVFIVRATAWFGEQPYALHEALFFLHRNQITQFGWLILGIISLITPVLVCFVAKLPRLDAICTLLISAAFVVSSLRVPESLSTFMELIAPVARSSQIIAAILLFLGSAGVISVGFYGAILRHNRVSKEDGKVDLWAIKLVIPFVIAYNALLITRATLFVRYALPLIPLLLLGLGLVFQGTRNKAIPKVGYIVVTLMLALAVIDNHDAYARLRALKKAEVGFVNEGGRRDELRAGFALDMWREIEVAGFVNDPRIVHPAGAYRQVDLSDVPCGQVFDAWTPHIRPRFSLSDEYGPCNQFIGRAPTTYATWWAPHLRRIVLGSVPKAQGLQRGENGVGSDHL